VFNRWGKKVFESSSSHPCWNGKKDGNGNDLSDGTYYIVVQVADKTYHGSVTLVR
jgi:gliding motility-associated-like protein